MYDMLLLFNVQESNKALFCGKIMFPAPLCLFWENRNRKAQGFSKWLQLNVLHSKRVRACSKKMWDFWLILLAFRVASASVCVCCSISVQPQGLGPWWTLPPPLATTLCNYEKDFQSQLKASARERPNTMQDSSKRPPPISKIVEQFIDWLKRFTNHIWLKTFPVRAALSLVLVAGGSASLSLSVSTIHTHTIPYHAILPYCLSPPLALQLFLACPPHTISCPS